MLCRTCKVRSTCVSICDAVETNLRNLESPCREQVTEPLLLADVTTSESAEGESVDSFWRIRRSVSALSLNQRKAIRAFFWDGQSLHEIACRQGMSLRTVRTHLARGLEEIRARMSRLKDSAVNPDLRGPFVARSQLLCEDVIEPSTNARTA